MFRPIAARSHLSSSRTAAWRSSRRHRCRRHSISRCRSRCHGRAAISLYRRDSIASTSIATRTRGFGSHPPFVIGLQQNVFRPNALKWDAREQDLRAETAERQYVEAREDVALATVNAFFDVYAARVALENATTNAAVNDTLYTLNKGRFEVGKIGENDLLQSELALLRMRTSLDAARLDFDRALANLRLQLNVAPRTPLDV